MVKGGGWKEGVRVIGSWQRSVEFIYFIFFCCELWFGEYTKMKQKQKWENNILLNLKSMIIEHLTFIPPHLCFSFFFISVSLFPLLFYLSSLCSLFLSLFSLSLFIFLCPLLFFLFVSDFLYLFSYFLRILSKWWVSPLKMRVFFPRSERLLLLLIIFIVKWK